MPLYEYSCPECEIVVEELRNIARADEPVECPVCHGLCVREVCVSFSVSRHNAAEPDLRTRLAQSAQRGHNPACSCCSPRRK